MSMKPSDAQENHLPEMKAKALSLDQSKTRLHILDCGLGLGFLLESPQGLWLIDCGSPGQEDKVLEKMKQLGRSDLRVIWITHAHYDHYGSAAVLRERTGALIGIHNSDADALANGDSPLGTPHNYGLAYFLLQPPIKFVRPLKHTPPDFTLGDNETLEKFGLEAVVLHTPGHTPGSSSLVLADGTAFAGDLIGSSTRPHLQNLLATDWQLLPGSLMHLQEAHPKLVFAGHSHRPVAGEDFQRL